MDRKLVAVVGASIIALSAMASIAAQTAGGGSGQSGALEQHIQRLKAALTQLDLSANQKTQIKTIFANTRAKLQSLRSTARNGASGAAKSQFHEIMQSAHQQILAVLSDPQKAKLKEILKSDRAQNGTAKA